MLMFPKNSIQIFVYDLIDVFVFRDVTLSKEYDIKILEQLKSGFKKTIKWSKYRSQVTIQPKKAT